MGTASNCNQIIKQEREGTSRLDVDPDDKNDCDEYEELW